MNVAWQLPLWGATVPGRLSMGRSRSCAATAAPTQGQTDVPRQAEFVICDQSIERTLAWFARYRRLAIRYERRDDVHLAFLHLASALVCLNYLPPGAGF